MMIVKEKSALSHLTSFGVGGPAERLVEVEPKDSLTDVLKELGSDKLWVLGYGTNVLISDKGLEGTTLLMRNSDISVEGETIIADAGALWDDVVKESVSKNLWGMELASGIPGSVGAGILINANAYGQSIPDRIDWIEAWDPKTKSIKRFEKDDLTWGYKHSIFQDKEFSELIITRASFLLSKSETTPLTYQSAIDVAEEMGIKIDSLSSRREVILKTREKAASIFVHGNNDPKTVGSFFRNPIVSDEQAEMIIKYDETGKTKEQIKKMNLVHGGDTKRVSAAHVMFASGFSRGQSWGSVRLHPSHVLKLENSGGATAKEIYDVAVHIMETVKEKLDITLEPEARIWGDFS